MTRIEQPLAIPREMSSRSAGVSTRPNGDEQSEQFRRDAPTKTERPHGLAERSTNLM
jgi:hypothetical protein